MARFRFDGQTAIITGAGRGLGRQYALLLASRGANVVVNDVSLDETSGCKNADLVAEEVACTGRSAGKALANYESVSEEGGAKRLFEAAMDRFRRVDILINNAGILRDRTLVKMSLEEWDDVVGVHLKGSFLVSRACWQQMRKQEYGKIIMTSSASGIYGNFGQANYASAKLGLVGLANTLAIEGRRSNIYCNSIVPTAGSSMTKDILPEDTLELLKPDYVAPLVAWLCHKECQESGAVYEAAGQWFGRHQMQRSRGKYLPGICDSSSPIEQIAAHWKEISSMEEGSKYLNSVQDHLEELMRTIEPATGGINHDSSPGDSFKST